MNRNGKRFTAVYYHEAGPRQGPPPLLYSGWSVLAHAARYQEIMAFSQNCPFQIIQIDAVEMLFKPPGARADLPATDADQADLDEIKQLAREHHYLPYCTKQRAGSAYLMNGYPHYVPELFKLAYCRQLFTLVSFGVESDPLNWESLLLAGRVTQQEVRHLPQLAEYGREHPENTTIFDSRVMLFRPDSARPDAPIVNATPASLAQIEIFHPDRLHLASPGRFTVLREDEKIQVTGLDAIGIVPDSGESMAPGPDEDYDR